MNNLENAKLDELKLAMAAQRTTSDDTLSNKTSKHVCENREFQRIFDV